jgi:hypothetical protein
MTTACTGSVSVDLSRPRRTPCHTGGVSAVLERLNSSLRRSPSARCQLLSSVRNVLVLASSSRSGSSVFLELLRRSPTFLCFEGELNPFLRLAGLSWPDSDSGSDALSEIHVTPQALALLDALLSVETTAGESGPEDWEHFLEVLYRRLCIQWPLEHFALDSVREAAELASRDVGQCQRLSSNSELAHFHALFLLKLRQRHPAVNPYYYDLPRDLVAALAPQLPLPSGPPSAFIIEEPPFVVTRPRSPWCPAEIERCTLVIKAPSNSYRLEFLRAMFPGARLRILHLTRNPGAAINGICDGWRHWGFHSHHIGSSLCPPGLPCGDEGWWKFDLPPGWQQYLDAPLERIAAFQWAAAHSAILAYQKHFRTDYFRVRFEDVLSGFCGCEEELARLRVWLGDARFLYGGLSEVPFVMTTRRPVNSRWRENIRQLGPAIRARSVLETACQIGYEDESKWI